MADLLVGGSARPPRRWPIVLAVLVLAAGGIAYLVVRHAGSSPHPAATPRLHGPAGARAGHPLLGVRAGGWELFGRGRNDVVRIQPAHGRATITPLPALDSSGPVYFFAEPDEVVVRPLDAVTGYRVPDGRSARPLTGPLAQGGPTLPGPRPDQVWIQTTDDPHGRTMVQHDTHGNRSGPAAAPLLRVDGYPEADGAGGILYVGPGGIYQAQATRPRLITSGTVIATGPTGWVTQLCTNHGPCTTALVPRDGDRRVLPSEPGQDSPGGVVSPDGRYAAVVAARPAGQLRLLTLATGAARTLPVTVDPDTYSDGTFVWSPDSRWLLVANVQGQVVAVDPHGGPARPLGLSLPRISQLAIR